MRKGFAMLLVDSILSLTCWNGSCCWLVLMQKRGGEARRGEAADRGNFMSGKPCRRVLMAKQGTMPTRLPFPANVLAKTTSRAAVRAQCHTR